MKFFSFGIALAALASIVSASPQLNKRASSSEAANAGYALYGGTTGGIGGTVTTITGGGTAAITALQAACTGSASKIVIVDGTFTGSAVINVGSNTSILGKNSGAVFNGVGFRVNGENNVIIRNVKISKVLADVGDAIGIQAATKVWIDHCDLSSDQDNGKDYYDGLLDITHGCDYVTVSYTKLHDHYKGSLVGHSDNNSAEDKGHLTVSYKHNYFYNINSRTPSFRFGTGHIWNNYFYNNNDGINTRMGAKLLVEGNVFEACDKALYSTDAGYAQYPDGSNDFGGATADALTTTGMTVPYSYNLGSYTSTKAYVVANAGNILTFG